MKNILNHLFDHKTLSRKDSEEVLINMANGKYSDAEMAAFITVYLMRSVTVEELSGFRDALLNLCVPVDLSEFNTIDLCGSGGDNKNTFNISTLASLVVAGAGGKVAKHGNYSVSSSCGSSNVMEYFGYRFSSDHDKLRRELDRAGLCFLHAPLFNQAMKNVAPVRKSLKVKTFFNMLGPLVNPASPKNQLVGVFSLELARLYQYIYQESAREFAIVHSLDGYDEVSLTGPVKILTRQSEELLTPSDLGFDTIGPEEIFGGNSVKEAAETFNMVLTGAGTPAQNNVVIANAGLGLQVLFPDKSREECFEMAKASLLGGKAAGVLKMITS